jgi:hypothetical protein
MRVPSVRVIVGLVMAVLVANVASARGIAENRSGHLLAADSPRIDASRVGSPGAAPLSDAVGDGAGGLYVTRTRNELAPLGYAGTAAVTALVPESEVRVFRVTSTGTIATGWPAEGVAPSIGAAASSSAMLVADGAGGVIVAWRDDRDIEPRLLAQRLNSSGSRLWGATGVIVSSGAGYRDLESVIPDGAGGVLVGWQESGADPVDQESDLRAQRLTSAGAVAAGWASDGVVLCQAPGQQRLLRMASDGAGGLIACWFDGRGFNPETYVQRIDASGTTMWDADGRAAMMYPPADIAADGASGAFLTSVTGGYVVVQRLNASGSMLWTPGGIAVSGMGQLWDPRVIADGAGGVVAHWCQQSLFYPPPAPSLMAMRLTSGGANALGWFTGGQSIGDSLSFGSVHAASTDGAGGFLFGWSDQRMGAAITASGDTIQGYLLRPQARRVSGTGGLVSGWPGTGIRVSNDSSAVSFTLAMVFDGAGGGSFTWEDARGGLFGQRIDGAGVKRWASSDVRLVANPTGQAIPAIGADGAGGSLVGWMDVVPGSQKLFTRQLDASGSPSAAPRELEPPGTWLSTRMVPDGTGGNFTLSGSYAAGWRIQRFDAFGAGMWDTMAVVGGPGTVSYVNALAGDGAGGVYVSWLDGSYVPTLQRLDAFGHPAWPALQPFGSDPFAFTLPGGALVGDGSGGVLFVQPRPVSSAGKTFEHEWVQRVDSLGTALWLTNGVEILSGNLDYPVVRAASDGAGGLLLAWTGDAFYTDADIWALRVDASGSAASGWPAAGVLVCGAAGRQLYPDVVGTGSGGSLLAWTDARGAVPQVYGQALDAAGAAQWTANGIPLGPGSGAQYLQQLVPDGAGGAIADWLDTRTGLWGLRAQRVDGSGVLLWDASGLDVVTGGAAPVLSPAAPGATGSVNLSAPVMAPDLSGGACFAWQEPATPFEYLVRAQHVNGAGVVGWPGGATGTLASLVTAHATPGLARLEWWSGTGQSAKVLRAESPGDWTTVATISPPPDGRYSLEDRNVLPGHRYGYRLVFTGSAGDVVADEVWLDVPAVGALEFAGASPNPATGPIELAFALRGGRPATLELFDVGGRRVLARDLSPLGAGSHRLRIERTEVLSPGMYVARLTEGTATRSRRIALTR